MHVTTLGFFTTIALGFAVGCVDTQTSSVTSKLEDSCTAELAKYDNFDVVSSCEKSNPSRVMAALEAIENAGGTCTERDDAGTCTSIDPVKDDKTEALRTTRIVCWWEPYCDSKGNCEIRETCCIENGPFPFPEFICGTTDRVFH